MTALSNWTLSALKELVSEVSDKLWERDQHPKGNGGEDEELFPLVLEALAVKLAAQWPQIYAEGAFPPTLDIATVLKESEMSTLLVVPADDGTDLESGEAAEELELLRGLFGDQMLVTVMPRNTKVHELPRESSGLRVLVVPDAGPDEVEEFLTALSSHGLKDFTVSNYEPKVQEIPEEVLERNGWVRNGGK